MTTVSLSLHSFDLKSLQLLERAACYASLSCFDVEGLYVLATHLDVDLARWIEGTVDHVKRDIDVRYRMQQMDDNRLLHLHVFPSLHA